VISTILLLLGVSVFAGAASLVCIPILTFGPGIQDYDFEIARGCRLVRCSSACRLITCPSAASVDCDVQRLAWNDRYIFAERYGPRIPKNATTPQGEKFRDWWIIDTINRQVEGPLDRTTYDRRMSELTGGREIALFDTELYGRDGVLSPASPTGNRRR